MAATQSEAGLAVIKVRTCLAFEARTFDGLHVAAITPVKKKGKKERVFLNLSNAFQVVLEFRSIPYTPFTPKLEHVQNLF